MTMEPQLLDSRGVGKVPTFGGRREDFEEWIFPFESDCGLLGWSALIEAERDHEGRISGEGPGVDVIPVNRSLYHLLASITKGTALTIVKLTDRGKRSGCCTRSTGRGSMRSTARCSSRSWRHCDGRESTQRFTETLSSWDELIARYEQPRERSSPRT